MVLGMSSSECLLNAALGDVVILFLEHANGPTAPSKATSVRTGTFGEFQWCPLIAPISIGQRHGTCLFSLMVRALLAKK